LLIALKIKVHAFSTPNYLMLQIGSFVVERSTSASGLAIVELALQRLNASLTLRNRNDRTSLRTEVSMELEL
jgi:hypothetical protein